jgi:hypothetical protein
VGRPRPSPHPRTWVWWPTRRCRGPRHLRPPHRPRPPHAPLPDRSHRCISPSIHPGGGNTRAFAVGVDVGTVKQVAVTVAAVVRPRGRRQGLLALLRLQPLRLQRLLRHTDTHRDRQRERERVCVCVCVREADSCNTPTHRHTKGGRDGRAVGGRADGRTDQLVVFFKEVGILGGVGERGRGLAVAQRQRRAPLLHQLWHRTAASPPPKKKKPHTHTDVQRRALVSVPV